MKVILNMTLEAFQFFTYRPLALSSQQHRYHGDI